MINPNRREERGLSRSNHKSKMSPIGDKRISKGERFEVLKDKIRKWWDDRIEVGKALVEIRDQKLYQEEFATFEEFCEHEYGFTRQHAYRLIGFAEVKASIASSSVGEKVTRESHARALSAVPEDDRVEVLTEASKSGPLTAKKITEAAKKEKPERLDKTGYRIPDSILDDWDEAESFRELITGLSRIKTTVHKSIEDRELAFREVSNTTVATLTNAYGDLKRVLPYAVCTSCQGHGRGKCTLCKGRGFISEFLYRTAVPEQTKKLREKK